MSQEKLKTQQQTRSTLQHGTELHYRWAEKSCREAGRRAAWETQEAQCHRGVACWYCLSKQWPAELI